MNIRQLFGLAAAVVATTTTTAIAEDRLGQMISPAYHITNFEDPRNLSEARLIYAYHEIDDKFVTAGGDVQIYALQLRWAINEDWAIIATKDGYVDFNPKSVLPHDEGLADVEAGVKYSFYRDNAAGHIASVQLRYLIPVGDEDVLQGEGDGNIHPSVSGAFSLTDALTFTAGTGLRIPIDSADSFFWDLDTQLDYRIDSGIGAFHPLIGVSLIQIADGGERLPIADEGQDFFNFGASEAGGESIVTGVAGLRYRPSEMFDIGGHFQFPFSHEEGNRVIDYRWLFDVIVRF